jgi:superfamily II DNA or RNA helicase
MTSSLHEKVSVLESQLQELEKRKSQLQNELENTRSELQSLLSSPSIEKSKNFSSSEKLSIFMNLFRGREDVFPKRWDNQKSGKSGYSPACHNEWVKGVCNKPHIKCGDCSRQAFVAVSEDIVRKHLAGENLGSYKRDHTIGVYPMLKDETCWFLAVDFDKEHWKQDVTAYLNTCRIRNVPVSLERSRSGNGAHVWIFFTEPIAASDARKMAAALLTETMEHAPELGFESYDRFFPNQDTMPFGGFGNLIALPLQCQPREKGNSVFLDENFEPYVDQWKYLVSIQRMTRQEVMVIVEEASSRGKITGVRMPLNEEDEKPWGTRPSSAKVDDLFGQKLPASLELVLSNQLFIAKQNLSPALINKFIRLAAFQNPDFYKAQAMRLSTFGKPRIIACTEDFPKYIGLPRGCVDEVLSLLKTLDIKPELDDKRNIGNKIKAEFLGKLSIEQEHAVQKMLAHDTGVLAATTAFGKTVVAAHIIAARKTNTLILVHRKQLLDQWVERLRVFLDIPENQIGIIGGGKRKPTGIIDVALIQSLVQKNKVDDLVANYGQLIIDECHHLSAVSFEAVTRASQAKYVLGLTATATRKDGHHPIIFMQCGPIRHKVDAKHQASLRPFTHKVIRRYTVFQLSSSDRQPSIQEVYAAITKDAERNEMIFDDVLKVLEEKWTPLLLTERKDHAIMLAEKFAKFCKHVILMIGGQSAKQRAFTKNHFDLVPETEERLIIATGRYIGEGFDDSRLDTLFFTMPISWHGTLAQYAGRLHRLHQSKKEVIIYDYVDQSIPMLSKMAEKRKKGYEKLGYSHC